MISHIIEYLKLPHPFKRGKRVVTSDPDKLAGGFSRIQSADRRSEGPAKQPRFLRVLVSPDDKKTENERLVKEFETESKKIHDHTFNWMKLRIFISLGVAGSIAYFLYWSIYGFPLLWFPSVWFINFFFGGSSLWGLFFGAVIILLPVKSLITNFFGGKRWNRIHGVSKYTELFSKVGKDIREKLKGTYIKKSFEILEKIAKQEKVDIGQIRVLVDEILSTTSTGADFAKKWTRKFDQVLEDLSSNCSDSFKGEITKLQDLKEDLLELFRQGFCFAPLVVVSPSSKDISASESEDINLKILSGGFRNKAKNLKLFLKETEPLQEVVWTNFELLDKAKGKSERVEILEKIQYGFERMRNLASGFHFGDNPNIIHQRGRNLSDFYDKLYELVGKAKNDIREGKKAARALLFSKLPVKTEAQQKKRISRLMRKIERVVGQKIEHSKTYDRLSHSFAWWGKSLARGIALSLILFATFTCLFSFKVLDPGQVLVTRPLVVGMKENVTQKEKILSRDLKFSNPEQGVHVGFGKRLFWHLPIPLTWVNTVELENQNTFTSHRILAGTGPKTLWQKGMSLLAGAFGGTYYEVLEINFQFKVKDPEAWARIDYDGQGQDRLARDITSILDNWQSQLFNFYENDFLVDIENEDVREEIFSGAYFEKLFKEGTLKEIIQRHISQSPFIAFQYGTVADRINPGIESILRELEAREARIKTGFIEVEDEEEELQKIEEFKALIQEYKDKIKELLEEELSELRKDPELLKKMIEDPRANIEELKNFEAVWNGIQQTIYHQYGMDKFKGIINGEFGEEKREELLESVKEMINEDSYFGSLVQVVSIETEIHFMSAMDYQQKIQKRMMELGELT